MIVRNTTYQKLSPTPNLTTFKHFFIALLFFILLSIFTVVIIYCLPISHHYSYGQRERITLLNILNPPKSVIINTSTAITAPKECNYWNCFDVYKCGRSRYNEHISVYVYPVKIYVNENDVPYTSSISKEFFELIDAIVKSKYYTADPKEACLFIPTIDLLNMRQVQMTNVSQVLQSLDFWEDFGINHLLFTMVGLSNTERGRRIIDLPIGKAMLAIAGADSWSFRRNFDVSIPMYSPLQGYIDLARDYTVRSWLVISSENFIHPDYMQELRLIEANHPELLILEACEPPTNRTERCKHGGEEPQRIAYPDILQKATFCLIIRGPIASSPTLLEAMASNCIPVIINDNAVLPFSPHIDWKRAAVFILQKNINTLMEVLKSISDEHIAEMQEQVSWLYESYFQNMQKIVITTLDIIQDRVNPQWARLYDDWNVVPIQRARNPLYLPVMRARSLGFTAVILTYDRIPSLFSLVEKLAKVPSLAKILVVWNNQKKTPPHFAQWPKIGKPLKVIETNANKLSNRFYPYAEIETEAILNIDDDIIMLTADELEFGYEVWREFPDRIVGFPSRTHRWDNVTNSWKYESEWTNDVSMVLTGAAFLHKYWSYAYTNLLPSSIRDWVDLHMNCEDIAMNFLVANTTNRAPIKVAPRKKFKCPECKNTEMLSADMGHMVERSACVDRFARVFGRMPLRSVEFRADPVLYKDPFPEKLKRFNDVGSL